MSLLNTRVASNTHTHVFSHLQVMVNNGQLKINATTSKDTGEYTCIATNDLDSDSAKATLEVKGMAVIPGCFFFLNSSMQFC